MTPAQRNGLDERTTALRDGVDELALRTKAVLAYLTTASPRAVPGAGLAPASVRPGWDAAAAGSGRTGTPPVPGPAG